VPLEECQRLRRVGCDLGAVPEAAHVEGEVLADVLLVVDDQDGRHAA